MCLTNAALLYSSDLFKLIAEIIPVYSQYKGTDPLICT